MKKEPYLTRRQALAILLAGGGFGAFLFWPRRRDKEEPMGPGSERLEAAGGESGGGPSCAVAPERLIAPLRACMESSGPETPSDPWDHACIHPRTVAYACGALSLPGGSAVGTWGHDHDPAEIARCRRLADEAARVMQGLTATGSESADPFLPFFIAASRGATPVPERITPDFVRAAFGGVIYPKAEIRVEPLAPTGHWWEGVLSSHGFRRDGTGQHAYPETRDDDEKSVERWRKAVTWFQGQEDLRDHAFVAIGENPLSDTNFASQFPRLLLGLTDAGSLTGVCGFVVHT